MEYGWTDSQSVYLSRVVPLYVLIQYLWFQLSMVYHALKKKIGKSKK
jgi:hypothetical protein